MTQALTQKTYRVYFSSDREPIIITAKYLQNPIHRRPFYIFYGDDNQEVARFDAKAIDGVIVLQEDT